MTSKTCTTSLKRRGTNGNGDSREVRPEVCRFTVEEKGETDVYHIHTNKNKKSTAINNSS